MANLVNKIKWLPVEDYWENWSAKQQWAYAEQGVDDWSNREGTEWRWSGQDSSRPECRRTEQHQTRRRICISDITEENWFDTIYKFEQRRRFIYISAPKNIINIYQITAMPWNSHIVNNFLGNVNECDEQMCNGHVQKKAKQTNIF